MILLDVNIRIEEGLRARNRPPHFLVRAKKEAFARAGFYPGGWGGGRQSGSRSGAGRQPLGGRQAAGPPSPFGQILFSLLIQNNIRRRMNFG